MYAKEQNDCYHEKRCKLEKSEENFKRTNTWQSFPIPLLMVVNKLHLARKNAHTQYGIVGKQPIAVG